MGPVSSGYFDDDDKFESIKFTGKYYANCPHLMNMHPTYDRDNPEYVDVRDWMRDINTRLSRSEQTIKVLLRLFRKTRATTIPEGLPGRTETDWVEIDTGGLSIKEYLERLRGNKTYREMIEEIKAEVAKHNEESE